METANISPCSSLCGPLGEETNIWPALEHKYHLLLRRFIARSIENPDDVDDLVQETWMDCFRGLPNYEAYDDAQFSTWLLTIAKNNLISFQRMKSRRIRTLNVDSKLDDIQVPQRRPSSESTAQELHEEIMLVLSDPVFNARADLGKMLTRYYLEERSTEEIAKEADRNPKAIRMRLVEARRLFKALWDMREQTP